MRLPDDKNKFTSRFRYVELARYWAEKDTLPREKEGPKENRIPKLFDVDEIPAYINRRGDTGIYTSVFQYDGTDLFNSASLGPMYFDLDLKDEGEKVRNEAFSLYEELCKSIPKDGIRFYFSGSKGYHIEVEPLVAGISQSDNLPQLFRYIAGDYKEKLSLDSIDFVVYDWRRIWRYPNTRHQKTGLYKVDISELFERDASLEEIKAHAIKPQSNIIPEQVFDFGANRWYRDYTYQVEAFEIKKKKEQDDLLAKFLADGSGEIKSYNKHRIFDKYQLLRGCPAIKDLEDKAKTEHFLTHYERLFLCSILTYDDEAIKYLHEILSKCDDYKFEISESHIDDWIIRRQYDIGGRPFTCQKAKEVGIQCSGCEAMEPRAKVVKLDNGKYMETTELSMPSPLRHAYSNKEA